MITLVPLREKNIEKIVAWNQDKGADFLRQWAGLGYHYPLSVRQVTTRLTLSKRKNADYAIFEVILDNTLMIGTMELLDIDRKTLRATMGRFLLCDEYRGRGYGTNTVRAMFRVAKNLYHIEELRLNVYEYNIPAQRCYEKAGFVFESLTEDVVTPKWSRYTYLAELYALDIESGERVLPELAPELLPDKEEDIDPSAARTQDGSQPDRDAHEEQKAAAAIEDGANADAAEPPRQDGDIVGEENITQDDLPEETNAPAKQHPAAEGAYAEDFRAYQLILESLATLAEEKRSEGGAKEATERPKPDFI